MDREVSKLLNSCKIPSKENNFMEDIESIEKIKFLTIWMWRINCRVALFNM